MVKGFLLFLIASAAVASAEIMPALKYQPLSASAEAQGQLARYAGASCQAVRLRVGDAVLVAQVPKMVQAYDVVPIRYSLTTKAGCRRTAVVATAFEDPAKTRGRKLYDLAVPGKMDLKVEYLGSVSADVRREDYIPLTGDPKTPVSPFPIDTQDPLVRSGEIRSADVVWYKWRLTNTGDTILDPEGLGACFGEPSLVKLDSTGKEEWRAQALNHYVRFLNYLYPGESTELWTVFYIPQNAPLAFFGLKPGDYRLDFQVDVRLHRVWDWGINIWGGMPIARLSVPLRCTETGSSLPVREDFVRLYDGETMPGYLESFEEFMTAFNIHNGADTDETVSGVVFLQVAPWTKAVTVKLILDQPTAIDAVSVPVQMSTTNLAIRFNPDNPMVMGDQPVFIAQAMPGMRSGLQLGPDVTNHLRAELREMKTLGVNVIANTAGDWWVPELGGYKDVSYLAAQYKWYYDVLVREEGIKLMGWSVYPPASTHWYYAPAEALLKKPVQPEPADARWTGPNTLVDLGDPLVPEVIAAFALHNFHRWGDLWYQTRDGVTPIDIEDTWGWQRDDINIRYPLGKVALQRFRDWLRDRYQTVEATNQAWGTAFASFDEIDPQADQGAESNNPEIKPVYNRPKNPFHDWSKAQEDWDRFRTWQRLDIYTKALAIIRQEIPGAQFALRTEGSNLVVPGDAESNDLHQRHIHFSQRRNAMLSDEITKSGLVGFHSDYTTLPYSPQAWSDAMQEMVRRGIRPAYLPTFNHMRDLVLNPFYGRDYEGNYDLDQPAKGAMIHCLSAAFPYWKATYEAGGAPGIIWSDFLCDAFATETQKRELAILTQQFRTMKRRRKRSA